MTGLPDELPAGIDGCLVLHARLMNVRVMRARGRFANLTPRLKQVIGTFDRTGERALYRPLYQGSSMGGDTDKFMHLASRAPRSAIELLDAVEEESRTRHAGLAPANCLA